MDKIAAYEIALSENPLWMDKFAEDGGVSPVALGAGALGVGGAALGGMHLYKKHQAQQMQAAKNAKRMQYLKSGGKVLGGLAALGLAGYGALRGAKAVGGAANRGAQALGGGIGNAVVRGMEGAVGAGSKVRDFIHDIPHVLRNRKPV